MIHQPNLFIFSHLQRHMAGSGSDGTEDSDSSAEREQTNSSESDGNIPKRQRLTRASTRLSQSSQGKSKYPINEKFGFFSFFN